MHHSHRLAEDSTRGLEEDSPPKSLRTDNPSYVTFVNRARSPVDLVWRDYQGRCVRYQSKFKPGSYFYVNTYETHPWQAWSSRSLEPLTFAGNTTFYPKPWRGEQRRTVVYVDEPLRPLLKLCLLKISALIDIDRVDELEIPQTLCDELRKKRNVEVRDFSPRRS